MIDPDSKENNRVTDPVIIFVVSMILFMLLASCAAKKLVNKPPSPEIVYQPECRKEIVESDIRRITQSVKRFCGERKVVRITLHMCMRIKKSLTAQVTYLCETPKSSI